MRIALLIFALYCIPTHAEPEPDVPFRQESAKHFAFPDDFKLGKPLCIAAIGNYVLIGGENGSRALFENGTWDHHRADSPTFAVARMGRSLFYAGDMGIYSHTGWNRDLIYRGSMKIFAMTVQENSLIAVGNGEILRVTLGERDHFKPTGLHPNTRSLAFFEDSYWLGSPVGLYQVKDGEVAHLFQTPEEIVSCSVQDITTGPSDDLWVASLGGITIFKGGAPVARHTPADGLPGAWVHAIARDTDGGMWAGTNVGAARWDGARWAVRHGKRWLLDDHVIDIAPDDAGGVWVLTRAGLSHIAAKQMTLAEKAQYFDEVSEARHVREPGLVEKIHLPTAGSLENWKPEDDDNDGEYTSQYLAAQAFRFAATGDEDARAKARRSWKALTFLQEVTGTDGFIARTVIPHDWEPMHDRNREYTPTDLRMEYFDDTRNKPVRQRWRPSADGKWQWKGDTSSDEITGHYYAFGIYYDLVATEEEKPAVREHVARVTDYLIKGGYNLIDTDGKHTRWGVWSPDKLNDDPQWQFERGINSAEMLGYLLTAWHITGEQRFRDHYLTLVNEHGYAENARNAKTLNPAWITYIDDCLLVCVYRPLLTYEKDTDLLAMYRESFDKWYANIRHDQNPWFNYTAGMLTGEEPEREDSLFFLRDVPLDLIEYTADQTKREDLTLVRKPILETLQTSKLLPPSERATLRWDKNPWKAIDGEAGHSERAPTFWLLAYWMGRHANFIAE